MARPTLIDLNLVELRCYPFAISFDVNVVEVVMSYDQKSMFKK